MGWHSHGEQQIFSTPWFSLNRADLELPDGRRIDHYLFRMPPVAVVAALDRDDQGNERVLMLWRHRFIPDTYGWELPAGIVDPAEDLAAAAAREALKESGWESQQLRPLLQIEPNGGITDSVHYVFWTEQAAYRGEPAAAFEAERIDWIALSQVPELIAAGQIRAAATVAALLLLLQRR
jgi:8-oxo-dGTP pyrophosphatase MutT (NUDIX family)